MEVLPSKKNCVQPQPHGMDEKVGYWYRTSLANHVNRYKKNRVDKRSCELKKEPRPLRRERGSACRRAHLVSAHLGKDVRPGWQHLSVQHDMRTNVSARHGPVCLTGDADSRRRCRRSRGRRRNRQSYGHSHGR